MADATIQISGLGTEPAPLDYDVPAAQSFDLRAVRAVFDGTGAAGAFLPCVQIFSSSGNLMATAVGSSVAAGADADVTFAPFLRASGVSTSGGDIRFNFDNEGGYLYVAGGNQMPFAGPTLDMAPSSIGLQDKSGGGIAVWDGDLAGGINLLTGPKAGTSFGGDGIVLTSAANGGIGLNDPGGGGVGVSTAGAVTVGAASAISETADTITLAILGGATGIGSLFLLNLPTMNPGAPPGQVWNNGGVLSIT